MSATPATTAEGGPRWGSEFFAVLQRIGRSLMLPIAVLPAGALLLRLGQDDLLGPDGLGWNRAAEIVGNAGGALFDNLPLLFTVGVAVGFARKSDGSTAAAALVGYLVFANVLKAFGPMIPVDPACQDAACEFEHDAPNVGVLGGIVIGLVAAVLWQRYYRIKLPPWLAFSGGRRFVPIITAFAALGLGVVFGIVWPPIGEALGNFAEWLYGLGPGGPGSTARQPRPHPRRLHHSIATGPLLIIPVGLPYAVLYYFLFRAHPPLRPGHTRPRTHEEEAEEAGLITRST